jgi:hypothetical protein
MSTFNFSKGKIICSPSNNVLNIDGKKRSPEKITSLFFESY